MSKELLSQNFTLRPFVRETNTANKTIGVEFERKNQRKSFQVRKELLSLNSTLRPFVRETNIANKPTTHRHDLHKKQKDHQPPLSKCHLENKTKYLCKKLRWKKWSDKFNNSKRLSMRKRHYWKHNEEELMMMAPVLTFHCIEAVLTLTSTSDKWYQNRHSRFWRQLTTRWVCRLAANCWMWIWV